MDDIFKSEQLFADDCDLRRIERFLYLEAELLDGWQYARWVALLATDAQYRVTAKVLRDISVGDLEFSLFEENAAELAQRVTQISSAKLTHAENPASTTRRFVTNILAYKRDDPGQFTVTSNILVYRSTIDIPEGAIYSGTRVDVLRPKASSFEFLSRTVRLDQAVMYGALSILL